MSNQYRLSLIKECLSLNNPIHWSKHTYTSRFDYTSRHSKNNYHNVFVNQKSNCFQVTAQDENGCYSNDTIVLKVVDCTSIDDYISNLTLYPNPTTGEFIVQHESLNNDIEFIKLLDLQARTIEHRKTKYVNGILKEKLDLSNLSSGIYLVELLGKKGKTVKKVILD